MVIAMCWFELYRHHGKLWQHRVVLPYTGQRHTATHLKQLPGKLICRENTTWQIDSPVVPTINGRFSPVEKKILRKALAQEEGGTNVALPHLINVTIKTNHKLCVHYNASRGTTWHLDNHVEFLITKEVGFYVPWRACALQHYWIHLARKR